MSNKKVLSQATRGLNKAKAPSKSRDIIYDPMGQWAHPGQNTRIPGGDITMQGVPYPVWAQPNVGQPQMMQPGQEYNFPEADYVDEYPQMKRGGYMKGLVPMPKPSKKGLASKAYSRSLDATNRLFTENTLFKKPKDRKRKVFDPNAKYYAEGGFIETELTDDEIEEYRKGGYIVEDISVPELQDGGIYTYAGRKDSKYKKDSNGNWLINNSSTGNKFIPIKDPTGERTMQLNKNAKSENSIDLSNISPDRSSSESTDTQGYKLLNKQFSEDKLNKQYQIHNEKQAAVDNYVEYIKKQKPFGKDTKKNKEYQDKAISDIRNKFIKNPDQAYTIAYNSTSHNKDIKALPKGSVKTGPSAYDVLTNPFDAFKYSVMTGDVSNMPANYNKFKRAGINPLDSHGGNLVGDQLNTMLNPVDMLDKTVHNINEGNYGTAGLHALRFVPFLKSAPVTKVLSGAQKVMAPVENVLSQPLINPSLINEYVTSNPTALNIAKNLTGSKVLGMEAAYKAANMTPEVTKAAYDAYTNSGKDSWKKLLEKTTKLVMNSSPIFSELKHVSPILSQVNNVVSEVKPYYSVLKNTAKSEKKPNDIDAKDVLSTVRSIPKLGLEKLGGEPNSMETELTDAEIEQLRKQGYVIELI